MSLQYECFFLLFQPCKVIERRKRMQSLSLSKSFIQTMNFTLKHLQHVAQAMTVDQLVGSSWSKLEYLFHGIDLNAIKFYPEMYDRLTIYPDLLFFCRIPLPIESSAFGFPSSATMRFVFVLVSVLTTVQIWFRY